jgi:uncharacterized membrane protein YdjX (TVP38/TMEM64 family)
MKKMTLDRNNIIGITAITLACLVTALFVYKLQLISPLVKYLMLSAIGLLLLIAILAILFNKIPLFRLSVTIVSFGVFFAILFWIFEISGFWDNVSTVENMQKFIKDQGIYSGVIFLLIQFLQVVAVPIPGVVTVAAGNVLFGVFWGSVLSYIGIILGSVTAFVIGRKFGYKLVVWIAGEETVTKLINILKGREKVMFTMIFLLPFFPDDMLCFVAGLTSMSLFFFTSMAMVTRIVTIAATSALAQFAEFLLVSRSIWGYAGLIFLGAVLLVIFLLTLKYGDKIQAYFEKKFDKYFKRKDKKDEKTCQDKTDD